MKAAVITFPGSNCDRDLAVAFESVGFQVARVWHKDTELPRGVDVVGIPGGFSFGDYLRCGAIAAQSPISTAVRAHADRGGFVLGICNGFQVVTEMGLLPGVLMRNAGLKFVCRTVTLRVATTDSAFTSGYVLGEHIRVPIAHHDGNYTIDAEGLKRLQGDDRIAFTYDREPERQHGGHRRCAVGKPPRAGDDAAPRAGDGPCPWRRGRSRAFRVDHGRDGAGLSACS